MVFPAGNRLPLLARISHPEKLPKARDHGHLSRFHGEETSLNHGKKNETQCPQQNDEQYVLLNPPSRYFEATENY
jgi:hypothetical protein